MWCYTQETFWVRDNNTTYTYDKNGNITKNGTTNLTYSTTIKDRLASFGSSTCSYNTNNPFMPTQIGSLQFTFEGNRLTGCNTSDKNITFTYDMKGLRKTKKYGSTVFDYYYSGDKLLLEETNNYSNRFLYDEKGQLYGFIQNGNKYFYVRDIMNNILGISSQTGELVVKYSYDAYGKLLSTTGTLASTVGVQNPFLYKGYIYDRETQLYYCNSRYYDPNIGRWISPDALEYLNPTSINGLNLYCYCNNNPIMYVDISGNSLILAMAYLLLVFTIALLVGVTYKDDGENKKKEKDEEENEKKSDGIEKKENIEKFNREVDSFFLENSTSKDYTKSSYNMTKAFYGPERINKYNGLEINNGFLSTGGSRFSYDGKDLVDILLDMRIW